MKVQAYTSWFYIWAYWYNFDTAVLSWSCSICTNPILYYSMKQAFLNDHKVAHPMRAASSNLSRDTSKDLKASFGNPYSNNHIKADEAMALKQTNIKRECNSPPKKTGSKTGKQSAKQKKKVVDQPAFNLEGEDRNLNRKKEQNLLQNTHYLNGHQYHFKRKQSKETYRPSKTNVQSDLKKTDLLSTDRFKKYNYMLSPLRSPKQKTVSTHSKKLLRSTQETFRNIPKDTVKKCYKHIKNPKNLIQIQLDGPKEYLLIQNHFLSIDRDEVCMLDRKMQTIFVQSNIQKRSPQYYRNINEQDIKQVEYSDFQKSYSSFNPIQKVIIIQRWWRRIQKKKQLKLKPILFHDFQPKGQQLQSKPQQKYKKQQKQESSNEISPLQFIQSNSLNHTMKLDSRQIQRKPNPLQQREQLAKQEFKVHKQLLEKLLKLKKITVKTHFEKSVLVQTKYHNEIQNINGIKRILSENTKIIHEMSQRLKEDSIKIDNINGQLSNSFLDQIFGSSMPNQQNKAKQTEQTTNISSIQRQVIQNRQKSNGCHYETNQSEVSQFYSKDIQQYQQDYEQDFENEQFEAQFHQSHSPEHNYNTNYNRILEQYKKQQQAAMEIDQRAAIQMGMTYSPVSQNLGSQIGIDTSLNGIHNFLLSFFKFYICYYRDEFLRLINMPYGYDAPQRIQFLQGYEIQEFYPQEDKDGVIYGLEDVIHQEILDEYYEKMHNSSRDPLPTTRRANRQFQKMHNRAIFDCFNAALNQFRPYYEINGTPYPWNYSEKALTFYCIAQQNIQQVFEKTQYRVLKWAATLCGIIVDNFCNRSLLLNPLLPMEYALDVYKSSTNPALFKARQERFNKDLNLQVNENSCQNWGIYDDQLTLIKFQHSDFVFRQIIQDFVLQLYTHQLIEQIKEEIIEQSILEKQRQKEQL